MELIEYFQSYENYFWEWVTDQDLRDNSGYHENNLISIPNVGTIAYRPYLIEILKELQGQGIPPLGSLLLVMYATQEGYLNLDGVFYFLRRLKKEKNNQINDNIKDACLFLENLSKIGRSLKKGQNRINLLQTIFKDSHYLMSTEKSGYIIKSFNRGPQELFHAAIKIPLTDAVISKDIRSLSLLYKKYPTTEAIVNAMQGIGSEPELDEEITDEVVAAESGRDFIEELTEEPKTFQVGSLIKRIWSGLKIPMRDLSPGEQPIGGISDMANKGEFHRMLLSEFANEDEVFMNRVANNEALYIQREIPPEENVFERIILIDASLKNWGTPKVLAFASAIAVVRHPKAHSECRVFALGQTAIPVSLNTISEVIENLNLVSGILDISETLETFFHKVHTEKDLEVFFITHHENLAHEKLQKVIQKNRNKLKFLITTSADGELNFYKHHQGTRKHVQRIVLPLQELWSDPPKNKHKRSNTSTQKGNKTEVPQNYPILFPTPQNQITRFMHEGEYFILSSKKQLLRTYLSDNYYNKTYYDHYRTFHGCSVLFDEISIKDKGIFALAKNKQHEFILCQYQPDKKLLSKLNINTKEYSELNVTGWHIPSHFELIYFNKHFYLYGDKADSFFEINIEGDVSLQAVDRDPEIEKNTAKVKVEVGKLLNNKHQILSNFTQIGINKNDNLVISQSELTTMYNGSICLYRNKSAIKVVASQNKNKFTFSDGSEIIADSRGMLTFRSINANIPIFYMPTVEFSAAALATETEFGGSEYYLPESTLLKVKTIQEMCEDYLHKFIDHVLSYGVEN